MIKVLALAAIIGLATAQTFTGSPAEIATFRSIKHMIVACEKKFICQSFEMNTNTIECIDIWRVCDGINDCSNMLDESATTCPARCPANMVICPDKRTCATTCDGTPQCPGCEDEEGCPTICPTGEVLCGDKKHCAKTCDHIKQCPDGRDESGCAMKCPFDYVQCRDKKKCARKCDWVTECDTGEDESTCPFQCICKRGQYICATGDTCIDRPKVCNEAMDCAGNDDEGMCA